MKHFSNLGLIPTATSERNMARGGLYMHGLVPNTIDNACRRGPAPQASGARTRALGMCSLGCTNSAGVDLGHPRSRNSASSSSCTSWGGTMRRECRAELGRSLSCAVDVACGRADAGLGAPREGGLPAEDGLPWADAGREWDMGWMANPRESNSTAGWSTLYLQRAHNIPPTNRAFPATKMSVRRRLAGPVA